MFSPLKVAILDLNNNTPNLGLNCIKQMVRNQSGATAEVPLVYQVFDVRHKTEVPNLDFDIYISSGGPGSPFEGEGQAWEDAYFQWLDAVWQHNQSHSVEERKHVFFICHSFQMMVRFFNLAKVMPRKGESFGIFDCEMTEVGFQEPCFQGLDNPFYIADFRKWQVVQPNLETFEKLGAEIICIEKERLHVPLERAIMGIRISPEMIGVQFHPEADPPGMAWHFSQPEREEAIKENFGEEKYAQIMAHLYDLDFLERTYETVLPNFLRIAVETLHPELHELV